MLNLGSRLSDLLSDIVLTPVNVIEVEKVSGPFTRVRIGGRAFARARWTPGDKLQLRVKPGTVDLRTYTPINWDMKRGVTDLVAFDHGQGPGARWFDEAVDGQVCEIFGPSRSIDFTDIANETVFIGDETSVALALVLQSINSAARYFFETVDPDALDSALTTFGLTDRVVIVPKSQDRQSLLERVVVGGKEAGGDFDLVVTGDAATVSAIRRAARHWPHVKPRIKARAYWATGRTGLS